MIFCCVGDDTIAFRVGAADGRGPGARGSITRREKSGYMSDLYSAKRDHYTKSGEENMCRLSWYLNGFGP
jgi:hypothetical protein